MARLSIVLRSSGSALLALLLAAPLARAQSGSPTLIEPEEIASANGKLRAVVALRDADTQVPNVGKRHLRYFQGWKLPDDISQLNIPAPPATRNFVPGPTLRARVGETVQLMFFNEVDERNFEYTNHGHDCDQTFTTDAQGNTVTAYPYKDRYPNCFHGSSTANLHYHGTHTSPDGLGDNVLLEIIPDKNRTMEPKWAKIFEEIFAKPIPEKFTDLPPAFWDEQKKLLPPAMLKANENRIAHGEWPQYFIGAFPNYFVLPGDPEQGSGYTAGQAPGTHWYHAHKHGSTALHILNGLAGVFIIEGPYDDYLRDFYGLAQYGNFEKVLIFQQVTADLPLEKQAPGLPPALLLNGQQLPILDMKRNEVQLWRILNATGGGGGNGTVAADFFTPANNFRIKQTALDGVQLSRANYQSQPLLTAPVQLRLAGGNRADVLVKAPDTAGTYAFKSNNKVVLYVRVTDETNPMCLPGDPDPCPQKPWPDMPKYLKDLPPSSDVYPHTVTFGWDPEPGRTSVVRTALPAVPLPPKFTIDNRQFAERGLSVDQCMKLGNTNDNMVQDWVIMNTSPTPHPFHIHVNPFQVLSIETPTVDTTGVASYQTIAPASDYIWRDVISIPAAAIVNDPPGSTGKATQRTLPGRVTIRQRFVDFTGTFMLHCHILAHEDRGMMQLVRVVKPDEYPERCQVEVPEHH
jgi:FtsP/CotA-like multicopper oxidase with cupredoxin domain